MSFNPNEVGVNNGNIFGFQTTENEAEVVLIPVPWDATASYGRGSSAGPKSILEASIQLDFFHRFAMDYYFCRFKWKNFEKHVENLTDKQPLESWIKYEKIYFNYTKLICKSQNWIK